MSLKIGHHAPYDPALLARRPRERPAPPPRPRYACYALDALYWCNWAGVPGWDRVPRVLTRQVAKGRGIAGVSNRNGTVVFDLGHQRKVDPLDAVCRELGLYKWEYQRLQTALYNARPHNLFVTTIRRPHHRRRGVHFITRRLEQARTAFSLIGIDHRPTVWRIDDCRIAVMVFGCDD